MARAKADLFARRPYWAHRFGVAKFLPTTRAEMDALGWDSCDVIVVTGDAYIDHPSFGMALVGRVLERSGFRVGVLAQPAWADAAGAAAFASLGVPNLFWGVTGGNMDSMVNRYTADRKPRSDDAYTAGGQAGARPDRCVIAYTQQCRRVAPTTPVVIGGIEASLRRVAHYDYWADRVRPSVLAESGADLLVYGNAERAIVEIAHRLAAGERIDALQDIRGTAFWRDGLPPQTRVVDQSRPSASAKLAAAARVSATATNPYAEAPACDTKNEVVALQRGPARAAVAGATGAVVRLPSIEDVQRDPILYAHASRVVHQESNPGNARALVQRHGARELWLNPPPIPLTTAEMDAVYELPYARVPHPVYGDAKIPAFDMIKASITIMRGCFGGCSFCSITEHEGRIIQSRSEESIVREVAQVRDTSPGFTGYISDLGGPTANMYRLGCKSPKIEAACRKPSCVYPDVCQNLKTDHGPLVQLYRQARAVPGIKKILIASGVRYDLAVKSPEWVRELAQHHVGGYLKIAPEHTEAGPLSHMMKPGIGAYDRFKALFDRFSAEAGKEQYLIPYFIAAHPGTTDEDMLALALWLKRNRFRPDQVQAFLPSPMASATAMYHTGKNPLRSLVNPTAVPVIRDLPRRRLHKAFLRYHDPNNWPLLREALTQMGRADLVGNGKHHLVPRFQPAGTGANGEGQRGPGPRTKRARVTRGTALTQHTGLPPRSKR